MTQYKLVKQLFDIELYSVKTLDEWKVELTRNNYSLMCLGYWFEEVEIEQANKVSNFLENFAILKSNFNKSFRKFYLLK